MKILVDSHVLLWALNNDKQLDQTIYRAIQDSGNILFVSIVTLWELRIKESVSKLDLPRGFYEKLQDVGYEILPVTIAHIIDYGELPFYHRDPFDRMLIAQARVEQIPLATQDNIFKKYKVDLLGV